MHVAFFDCLYCRIIHRQVSGEWGDLKNVIGVPLAELCGTDGVDTIAHGNDCIEVVELRVASHLSRTFLLNYRDFLGSCLLVQFIRVIYVLYLLLFVICSPMASKLYIASNIRRNNAYYECSAKRIHEDQEAHDVTVR